MVAGLGRKVFGSETLSTTEVQGYFMDQSVMQFDTASQRTALLPTPQDGNVCYLRDTDQFYGRQNGAWVVLRTDRTIGDSAVGAGNVLLTGTPGWTTVVTVAGTSTGLPCVARWSGTLYNGGSGADRLASWRVTCDGADIGSLTGINVINVGSPRISKNGAPRSTPAAGAHTWLLQANAAIASAVYAESGALTVVEVAA